MAFFLIFRDFGRIWGEEKRSILTTDIRRVGFTILFKIGAGF